MRTELDHKHLEVTSAVSPSLCGHFPSRRINLLSPRLKSQQRRPGWSRRLRRPRRPRLPLRNPVPERAHRGGRRPGRPGPGERLWLRGCRDPPRAHRLPATCSPLLPFPWSLSVLHQGCARRPGPKRGCGAHSSGAPGSLYLGIAPAVGEGYRGGGRGSEGEGKSLQHTQVQKAPEALRSADKAAEQTHRKKEKEKCFRSEYSAWKETSNVTFTLFQA